MARKARVPASAEPPPACPWYRRDWFLGLLLFLGIFLTYQSVRTAGFV